MSDPASTTTTGGCCSPAESTEADQAPADAEASTRGTEGEKAPEASQQAQPVAATFGRCC